MRASFFIVLSALAAVCASSVIDISTNLKEYTAAAQSLSDAAVDAGKSTDGNVGLNALVTSLDTAALRGAALGRDLGPGFITTALATGITNYLGSKTVPVLKKACNKLAKHNDNLANVEYDAFRNASRHTSLWGKRLGDTFPVASKPALAVVFDEFHRSFNNCKSALTTDGVTVQ